MASATEAPAKAEKKHTDYSAFIALDGTADQICEGLREILGDDAGGILVSFASSEALNPSKAMEAIGEHRELVKTDRYVVAASSAFRLFTDLQTKMVNKVIGL